MHNIFASVLNNNPIIMTLADRLIQILHLPENKILIENGLFCFESFEFPFDYVKGYVVTTDDWINPKSENWEITYMYNGDLFNLEEPDRIRFEEWICDYYTSVTGEELN